MPDEIFVQIRFVEDTEFGEYHDCIYYSLEEYKSVTEQNIIDIKKSKLQEWLDFSRNPPVDPEPLKEEILFLIEELDNQKVELQIKLIEEYDYTKEELQKIADSLENQKDVIQEKIDEIEDK